MTPHSAEIAYLRRLIEDFPAKINPAEAGKAHKKIAARYSALEQVYHQLAKEYQSPGSQNKALAVRLKQLAYATHGFLFEGVLSNAGQLRKNGSQRRKNWFWGNATPTAI